MTVIPFRWSKVFIPINGAGNFATGVFFILINAIPRNVLYDEPMIEWKISDFTLIFFFSLSTVIASDNVNTE